MSFSHVAQTERARLCRGLHAAQHANDPNLRSARFVDERRGAEKHFDVLAAASVTASFPTKAPFNLCADSSERYLASSVDVRAERLFAPIDDVCLVENRVRVRHSRHGESVDRSRGTRTDRQTLVESNRVSPVDVSEWSAEGSRCRASQLGYCIRDSPKFHVLSVTNQFLQKQDVDVFVHRVLQCNCATRERGR